MLSRSILIVGLAVVVGYPAFLQAQVSTTVAPVIATRVSGETPRLDGKVDDGAWQNAQWVSGFTQREPVEGAPPSASTAVAFLFDDAALYIAARMQTPKATAVRALVTRRDREGSSDQIVISLDTYHDRRTAYSFGVTASGVRIDYLHPSDAQSNRDYLFDPVWEAATQVSDSGWTAEIKIPFSQLRFNSAPQQVWGVNLTRVIPATNEEDYLVLVRRNETGWASRFAELRGIDNVRPSRRIELLPYVATSEQMLGNPDLRNPFVERNSNERRAGLDVKVGLGPSLTLDATINPDFGQVEADPAEVNLSAFETVFAERRPFFTEGAQLLRANNLSFFVSRRIGQAPRYSPPADFVEPIINTTILGAAKVTGRLPSGLSVGALGAVTDRERVRTFDEGSDEFGSAVVEPLTSFGVVRLQQEFGANRSTAGVILTNVNRRIDAGSPLAAILARNAITGAAEWQLRFKKGEYIAFGSFGFSHVTGDSTAILRIQRSPAHFFGRPDAPYASADPSREALNGTYTTIGASKNAGRLLLQANVYGESPGLEINDAGRIGQADDRGINFFGRYRQTVPGKTLRYWDVGVNNFNEWNYGGIRQSTYVQLFSNQTLRNFWNTSASVAYSPAALIDNLTRGGPLMGYGASWSASASVQNGRATKTSWRTGVFYAGDRMGGWSLDIDPGISVRPGNRIELSINPSYSRSVNPRQFYTVLSGGSDATFGKRYVFSFIERSELSSQLRLNYALRPDLTLETYAEPFASSGRFYKIGELPAARSYSIRQYGTDGTTMNRFENDSIVVTDGAARFRLPVRDFNVLSFRSNFVLRWEWRPGSTAFLVWQQNRGDQIASGRLIRPSNLVDAVTANGDNVLAVKVNYWISF